MDLAAPSSPHQTPRPAAGNATARPTAARSRARRTAGRPWAVAAAAVALVLPLSACAGLGQMTGAGGRHVRTWAFDSGAAGKQRDVLPSWVPDDATGVRLASRTTGSERILTMHADLADLPSTCERVSGERPLAPRPVREGSKPQDFRTVSTLKADWWPAEQEQAATVMCGAWWVAAHDGSLYAFTPELRTIPVD